MFFSGSLQSPTVLATPGLVPPLPVEISKVMWGEDISFTVPDPGENCTVHMTVRAEWTEEEPLFDLTQERTGVGELTFTIPAGDARRDLIPGIFLFQAFKDVEGVKTFYPEGKFELWESAGSRSVPPSVEA